MRRSSTMHATAFTLAAVLQLNSFVVDAYPSYERFIPNSQTFNPFTLEFAALGHRGDHVDDNVNAFGLAFENAGETWALLCSQDTDNDGFSNGVELGDPGCTYLPGASIGPALSDPLDASSIPADPGFLGSPYPPATILAHGAMMIIAWAVFAPTGIAIATILKKGENPIWFKVHRVLLILAVILTIVGFGIILVSFEKDGSGFPPRFSSAHTGSGLAVVLLAIAQTISGFARPDGGKIKTQNRLAWEFGHQWLGRITVVVAFYATWTGLEMGFAFSPEAFEAGKILFGALFAVAGVLMLYAIGIRDKGVRMPWAQPKGAKAEEAVTPSA